MIKTQYVFQDLDGGSPVLVEAATPEAAAVKLVHYFCQEGLEISDLPRENLDIVSEFGSLEKVSIQL